MKSKATLSLMIAGLALAGTLLLLAAEGRFKRLQKNAGRNVDFTEVILPVNKQTAVRKIAAISYGIAGLNRGVTLKGKFANFWLSDFHDSSSAGDDYQLRAHSSDNPALQRYSQLSPESRRDDFYLSPQMDFYWPSSEYTYRGKPAQFTCYFIIHLEDAGNSTTKLEVIETSPVVKIGERLGLSAHSEPFPQFFYDIRQVAPTTEDRQELLEALEQTIKKDPSPVR